MDFEKRCDADNEFLTFDRIVKIRSIVEKYGEDKCYISFSGGKDSTVLSYLVDLAVPGNKIPRIYNYRFFWIGKGLFSC